MGTLRARAAIAIVSVPVLLARAGVAFAQEPEARADDQDRARALFREGRALARAGDYEHACPKLEESRRLRPGVSTDFNVADCWEHTGRIESAHELFLRVATVTHDLGDVERERAARARAKALEASLSAEVATAGRASVADAVTAPRPVQRAEGRSTTPRWILLGAAGAGAVTAGVAFALYAHSDSEARDVCRSPAGCADAEIARHQSLVDDARTARAVGIAGLAVAGASLLGATVFFIREHEDRGSAKAAAWGAAVAGGPDAATLVVKGSF